MRPRVVKAGGRCRLGSTRQRSLRHTVRRCRVDNLRGGSSMPLAAMLKSAILFVAAGLCEIGGGYLVWQWLRNGRGLAMGVVGSVVLVLYGVIPTFQPQHFSRVYAAYGGVFVALSLAWGWILDGQRPDRFDLL